MNDVGEQQKNDLAAMREKHENGECEATWGTCTGKLGAFAFEFGKPSKTPHRCKGERKHRSRLHACEVCGIVGHRILPTKLSNAGRELSRMVAAAEKERKVRMDIEGITEQDIAETMPPKLGPGEN